MAVNPQPVPHKLVTGWKRVKGWVTRHKWELLLVVFWTSIAAFLRIYRLADLPPGLHGDEALTGLDALRVIEEGWIGPYVESALGQPTGPLYYVAFVFKLSQPSLFTVRLSIATLGIATLPLAYLLFRMSFGRWVALFGMVALTVGYWHLHYSRTAFMVVSMPLMISLASMTILWAMRSPRKWLWFLAGMVLGIGLYSYNGYPVFLVAVVVLLAVHLALHRSQSRELLTRYLLLGCGLLLAALPLIQFAVRSPDIYFSHAGHVSLLNDPRFTDAETTFGQLEFVSKRTWDALTRFFRHPNLDYTDAMGGRGSLDPVLAVLAYLGLGILLVRWRSPPHLLTALAMLAGMAATVLATWGPGGDMRRSLVAVPFVYAAAGVAAMQIVMVSQRIGGKVGYHLALTGITASLVAVIVWNSWYYFGNLVLQDHTRWVFTGNLVDGLDAAHRFDEPGRIYFYSRRWSYDYETRLFLYPELPGIDRSREFGSFSLERLDPGPVTYLLLPPYHQELERLTKMYPQGTATLEYDNRGAVRFAVYHLQ